MTHIVAIDSETTGLDIDRHPIWELALIVRGHEDPAYDGEWVFQFPVSLDAASPEALKMTDFINRYTCWNGEARVISHPNYYTSRDIDEEFFKENPKFNSNTATTFQYSVAMRDRERIAFRFEEEGRHYFSGFSGNPKKIIETIFKNKPHLVGAVPDFDAYRLQRLLDVKLVPWHYHLIDVENLAVGYLAGQGKSLPDLPWNSDELSRSIGVEPPTEERHTALGDARWALKIYDRVVNHVS